MADFFGDVFDKFTGKDKQQEMYRQTTEPSVLYQQRMLPLMEEMATQYAMPYIRQTAPEETRLQTQYALPLKESMYQYAQGLDLSPEGEQALSNKMYQQARQKMAMPYEQIKQNIGETAAGMGTLRSGVTQQLLNQTDLSRLSDEYNLAADYDKWAYDQTANKLGQMQSILGMQQYAPSMPSVSTSPVADYQDYPYSTTFADVSGGIGSLLGLFL